MLKPPPTFAGAGHIRKGAALPIDVSSLVTVATPPPESCAWTLLSMFDPFPTLHRYSSVPASTVTSVDHGAAKSSRPGSTLMNFRRVIGFAPGFLQYKYPLNVASTKG